MSFMSSSFLKFFEFSFFGPSLLGQKRIEVCFEVRSLGRQSDGRFVLSSGFVWLPQFQVDVAKQVTKLCVIGLNRFGLLASEACLLVFLQIEMVESQKEVSLTRVGIDLLHLPQ